MCTTAPVCSQLCECYIVYEWKFVFGNYEFFSKSKHFIITLNYLLFQMNDFPFVLMILLQLIRSEIFIFSFCFNINQRIEGWEYVPCFLYIIITEMWIFGSTWSFFPTSSSFILQNWRSVKRLMFVFLQCSVMYALNSLLINLYN